MKRWLVSLYPRAWRQRYGDELAELLAGERLTARLVFDLVRGALDAHWVLWSTARRSHRMAPPEPVRWRYVMLSILLAIAFSLSAGAMAVTANNYALLDLITDQHTPPGTRLQAVAPAEFGATARIVAHAIAGSLALPVVAYALLTLVGPRRTVRDARRGVLVVSGVTLCFGVGLVAGWFLTVPPALNFLLLHGVGSIATRPTVEMLLSLVVGVMLLTALLCTVPLTVVGLVWLGAVRRSTLGRARSTVLLSSLIVAALVTPTSDPVNQLIVGVPLYGGYELGLLLALLVPRRPASPMTT